jgi:feruloyl esterase
VIDPRTGQEVSTGLEPGSELHWDSVAGDRPHPMYNDLLRFVVFKDANWDYRTLDVAKHLDLARKVDGGILAATSTDLKRFMNRGGKLLIYHGWEDQNIPPLSSVNYYQGLLKAMGKEQADSAVRLYMVPGMGHCGGGEGVNTFDLVAALDRWVETKRPPDAIPASRVVVGQVVRTRPLCPYPQVASYKGAGDTSDAANFVCN